VRLGVALVLVATACGRDHEHGKKLHKLPLDEPRPPPPFTEIVLSDAPSGLSGTSPSAW